MTKSKQVKVEPAEGWGLRVGGCKPYIGYHFSLNKEEIEKECTVSYRRPIRVVIVGLKEFEALLKRKDVHK